MPDDLEGTIYNTQMITLLNKDGVSGVNISKDLVLSNEFELAVLAPHQVSDAQDTALFALTFKGIDPEAGVMKAVSVMFAPELYPHLARMLRLKYMEIPIEHR